MISFVFSGEGARGSVQSGVVLDLYRKGIKADFVCGTSSGSANSIGYAYLNPEGLADMWSNVKNIFSLFSLNWNFLWNTGIFNLKPTRKIFFDMIKNKPICESMVSRLNIETGELQYVKNTVVTPEEFAEAAISAVSVPGVATDNFNWIDAGIREMAPLQQCIDNGATEVYIILGRPFSFPELEKPTGLFAFAKMVYRAIDISLYELLLRDIRICIKRNDDPNFKNIKIHIMEPNELLYDTLAFNYCKLGVEYGQNNYKETVETGMLKSMFKL
jgi:predicted acylesterase/phospholipase RssA